MNPFSLVSRWVIGSLIWFLQMGCHEAPPAPVPDPTPADDGDAYSCSAIPSMFAPDQLPPELAAPPTLIAQTMIEPGDHVEFGELRLWVGEDFVPRKIGSSEGNVETFLRAAILPDYERHGIDPNNYVHAWTSPTSTYVSRLRQYRYRPVAVSEQGIAVAVQRVACSEWARHDPLSAGETLHYWLSTQGTTDLQFATSRYARTSEAWINVLQSPYPERGGWIIHVDLVSEGRRADGATLNPLSADYRATYEAGSYRARILRVELGRGTRFIGTTRYVASDEPIPNVHVLMEIAR